MCNIKGYGLPMRLYFRFDYTTLFNLKISMTNYRLII